MGLTPEIKTAVRSLADAVERIDTLETELGKLAGNQDRIDAIETEMRDVILAMRASIRDIDDIPVET